jgi:hypothetical protein
MNSLQRDSHERENNEKTQKKSGFLGHDSNVGPSKYEAEELNI